MFTLYRLFRSLFKIPLAALGISTHECRFIPSCSEYCELSLKRFGVLKGGWLCLYRLSRCRPGGSSGLDPVPEN